MWVFVFLRVLGYAGFGWVACFRVFFGVFLRFRLRSLVLGVFWVFLCCMNGFGFDFWDALGLGVLALS